MPPTYGQASPRIDDSDDHNSDSGTRSFQSIQDDTSGDGKQNDSPEAMILKENRALLFTRLILASVLLMAALATSSMIFYFLFRSQHAAFEAEAAGIGVKMTQSMLSDTAWRLWIGRSLSTMITMTLAINTDSTIRNLTLPATLWNRVNGESRYKAEVQTLAWSPLLRGDEERLEFEAYAAKQTFTVGQFPICYACGSAEQSVQSFEQYMSMPGFGKFHCSTIETLSRQGQMPESACKMYSKAVQAQCQCGPTQQWASTLSNVVNKPEALFELKDDGKTFGPVPYGQDSYLPLWQTVVARSSPQLPVMYNLFNNPVWKKGVQQMLQTRVPVSTSIYKKDGTYFEKYTDASTLGGMASTIFYPIYRPTKDKSSVVDGVLTMEVVWSSFGTTVWPTNSHHLILVVHSSCEDDTPYSFQVTKGSNFLIDLGPGDLHDPDMEEFGQFTDYGDYSTILQGLEPRASVGLNSSQYCQYRYSVYPTQSLMDLHVNHEPILYACVTLGIFVFTTVMFMIYDRLVSQRQEKVMESANRTNDIVTNLFPENVRERLYEQQQQQAASTKKKMRSFLEGGVAATSVFGSEPIADLFPHAVRRSPVITSHYCTAQRLKWVFFSNVIVIFYTCRLSCFSIFRTLLPGAQNESPLKSFSSLRLFIMPLMKLPRFFTSSRLKLSVIRMSLYVVYHNLEKIMPLSWRTSLVSA